MALTPQMATSKKLGAYELTKETCASSVGVTSVATHADRPGFSLVTRIHRHIAKSPQLVNNLQAEAKRSMAIESEHVARIVDTGVVDGEPFVVHEHVEGETLASLLRRAGPDGLPLEVAARVALDVLEAVEAVYVQDATLGHGELGPWCIHVGADGKSRVSGFAVDRAIARFGLHFVKNLERLTYAAPENVKAMSLTLGPPPPAPDVKADTFSAAVLAWELFTRQRLFTSRMEAAIIQKVLTGPIPDARSQRDALSSEISDVLASALSRDPAARPSPSMLAAALGDGDVASHEAVAEFASQLVDKSQSRINVSAPKPAGTSPASPGLSGPSAPVAKATNGTPAPADALPTPGIGGTRRSRPPPAAARPPVGRAGGGRAKTLLGLDAEAISAAAGPPLVAPEEPSSETSGERQITIADDPSTGDADLLVEVDAAAAPAPPAPAPNRPAPPPPKGRPPAPPAPKRPPPPRAPGAPETPAPSATAPSTTAPSTTAPSTTAAAPVPAARPADSASSTASVERLRTGATLGKAPNQVYELIDAVARGGMATVWAARPKGSNGLDSVVGIKTMLPELSDDPDFESMFVDEMRVAAKIKHTNVAQILGVGDEDEVMYLVMEWVEGETIGALQKAARTDGGIPLPILLRIAVDICAGLHAAHETRDDDGHLLDLVHRDVNPTNVVVDSSGHAKILDFGIAKSKGRLHVTRVGSTVKGKTPYLSPEQLGGLPLDRRSDLFSLGALLYVMATGLHPFRGDSELKTVENIALKAPAPLRSVTPSTHPEFEEIVLKLLEKETKKRFATAAETREALERLEKTLEKPATTADVGEFVRRVVGKDLEARRQKMIDALRTIHPDEADKLTAAVSAGDKSADPLAPLASAVAAPAAVDLLEEATTNDLSAAGLDQALGIGHGSASVGVFDSDSEAGLEGASPTAPDEDPTLIQAPSRRAAAAADDDDAEIAPKPRSQVTRLVMLIVAGIVVGVGVIALIEAMRGEDPPKTVASTPTAIASPAPRPVETVPPPATAVETAAPVVTAEPTAEPTATAEPTTEPTAEPPPTATTPPTPPPTGRPKPGPTGTGKPRPPKPGPKYNPTTI